MFKFIAVVIITMLATFAASDAIKAQLRKLELISVDVVKENVENTNMQIRDLQRKVHAVFMLEEALKEQIDCMQELNLIQMKKLEQQILTITLEPS